MLCGPDAAVPTRGTTCCPTAAWTCSGRGRLLVAGPDTRPHRTGEPPAAAAGLRFAPARARPAGRRPPTSCATARRGAGHAAPALGRGAPSPPGSTRRDARCAVLAELGPRCPADRPDPALRGRSVAARRGAARPPRPPTSWAGHPPVAPPLPRRVRLRPDRAAPRPALPRALALRRPACPPPRSPPRRLRRPAALSRDVRALAGAALGRAQPRSAGAGRTGRRRCRPGRGPRRSAAPRTRPTARARRGTRPPVISAYSGVDPGGRRAARRRGHPAAPLGGLHAGWKRPDRLLGVQREPQPAGQRHLDVRLRVGRRRERRGRAAGRRRAGGAMSATTIPIGFESCDHADDGRPAPPAGREGIGHGRPSPEPRGVTGRLRGARTRCPPPRPRRGGARGTLTVPTVSNRRAAGPGRGPRASVHRSPGFERLSCRGRVSRVPGVAQVARHPEGRTRL